RECTAPTATTHESFLFVSVMRQNPCRLHEADKRSTIRRLLNALKASPVHPAATGYPRPHRLRSRLIAACRPIPPNPRPRTRRHRRVPTPPRTPATPGNVAPAQTRCSRLPAPAYRLRPDDPAPQTAAG